MSVTLEVSQLDTSALKLALHGASLMSAPMCVTADTSQEPIVPCVASAAASSAQNSASAAASSALVANTVADAAWAIASTPSRRQCSRGKALLPVERDAAPLAAHPGRVCVGDSRGFCVPMASVCPAAAVDIGYSLAAAGGLGTGLAGLVWRAISGGGGGGGFGSHGGRVCVAAATRRGVPSGAQTITDKGETADATRSAMAKRRNLYYDEEALRLIYTTRLLCMI